MKIDKKALVTSLNNLKISSGLSWREIERQSGVYNVSRIVSGEIKNPTAESWQALHEAFPKDIPEPFYVRGEKVYKNVVDNPSNVAPAYNHYQIINIPLISWVQAGDMIDTDCQTTPGYADEWITTTETRSKSAFALRVRGDSMEPEFAEGDIITVDPDKAAVNGKFVIVKNGTEATFKQYVIDGSHIFLKPLNNRYPIRDMTGIEFQIVGVVVEKRKCY